MFDKLKRRLSKARARKRLKKYDQKHRKVHPSFERPAPLPIEITFDSFVAEFGGAKISELIENKSQMSLNADYLFAEQNVIAELKTLEGVFSGPDSFAQLTQAYIDAGFSGSDVMRFFFHNEPVPDAALKLIRKRVRRSLEQRIKHARKQLRVSKSTFGNEDTRLLILIAMDQQPLFGHRNMLFNLATIMGDNYADEHTDALVYLNPNTPTQINPDSMEYSGWWPMYRDDNVNNAFSDFVNLLGNKWLNYYGKQIGETNPIMEFKSFEEMTAVFDQSSQ